MANPSSFFGKRTQLGLNVCLPKRNPSTSLLEATQTTMPPSFDAGDFPPPLLHSTRNEEATSTLTSMRAVTNLQDALEEHMSVLKEGQDREIDALREEVAGLKKEVGQLKKKTSKGKLPTGISSQVHALYYNFLEVDDGWNLAESALSPSNKGLTEKLTSELVKQNEGVDPKVVKRAVSRFFEGQRRRKKEAELTPTSKNRVKQNRLKITKRHRLFEARGKAKKNAEDTLIWDRLNPWAMSDESEDEDGKKIFRSPPWRSPEVTDLIERIDDCLKIKRNYGEYSERKSDSRCEKFSISL